MASNSMLLLGLLAIVLLIASEVAARDLAETSNSVDATKEAEKQNGLHDAKYPGGGYGGYPGRGGYGGGYPGRGGYGGGRGGYCRFGCCGRSYYRGGCRCCKYAGEAVDADFQAEPRN